MRVGFGASAWVKGLERNHLDGIGVYSKNLWQNLLDSKECDLHALRFGACDAPLSQEPSPLTCVPIRFKRQVALSIVTGSPFNQLGSYERSVDVFHATDHHIPKLRSVPVVATLMDAIPFVHPEWVSRKLRFFKNFAFKRSAHWAERIITISEYSKHDISEHFSISLDRIDSIPLGVDDAFYTRVSAENIDETLSRYQVPQRSFVFVGTLQPRKNVRRIIQAHRQLPSMIRKEHPLLIIGKFGWGDPSIVEDLHAMEQTGQGRWLDDVSNSDLHAFLQSAAALVYPSLYEGFGLPILEGFASGLPVISSNTTSIPEVAGDAALLVDPESTDEIADAMQRIVEDSALADSLIARGAERVKQFTWSKCAEQTMTVYKQLG